LQSAPALRAPMIPIVIGTMEARTA
jgi:hypothetical protein